MYYCTYRYSSYLSALLRATMYDVKSRLRGRHPPDAGGRLVRVAPCSLWYTFLHLQSGYCRILARVDKPQRAREPTDLPQDMPNLPSSTEDDTAREASSRAVGHRPAGSRANATTHPLAVAWWRVEGGSGPRLNPGTSPR